MQIVSSEVIKKKLNFNLFISTEIQEDFNLGNKRKKIFYKLEEIFSLERQIGRNFN